MKTITEVVADYGVDLKQVGTNIFRGFCPFHADETKPNLTVYPLTNSWYCWVCQIGGDAVNFVQRYENCSKAEALQKVGIGRPSLEQLRLELLHSEYADRLNKIDFGLEVDFIISKCCYQFLRDNPKKSDYVFDIFRRLDQALQRKVTYVEAQGLIQRFLQELKTTVTL